MKRRRTKVHSPEVQLVGSSHAANEKDQHPHAASNASPETRTSRSHSAASALPHQAAASPGVQTEPSKPPPKDWKNRLILGWAMVIAINLYMFYLRQPGVVVLVFIIQAVIYSELVKIATMGHSERDLPRFRWFYVYWFFVAVFFMYTKTLQVPLLSSLTSMTSQSLIEVCRLCAPPLRACCFTSRANSNAGGLADGGPP